MLFLEPGDETYGLSDMGGGGGKIEIVSRVKGYLLNWGSNLILKTKILRAIWTVESQRRRTNGGDR